MNKMYEYDSMEKTDTKSKKKKKKSKGIFECHYNYKIK